MRFVLVHSPLLGPRTWRSVAEVLVRDGHQVAIPDLRAAASTGDPEAIIAEAAAAAAGEPPVMVGHSGAGTFLPYVVARASPGGATVFGDAALPPCEGAATVGGDFLEPIRALAVNGSLPRWSTWWEPGAMEQLIPNDAVRAEVEAEQPSVPLRLFESTLLAPSGWCEGRARFLLLTEIYREEAERARSLGWPVREVPGNHLALVNDPERVAQAVVELLSIAAD